MVIVHYMTLPYAVSSVSAACKNMYAAKLALYALDELCYNVRSNMYWRLSPMASTKTPSARELRKKKIAQVVAIVACAALLATAILPFLASAIY